jgi:hypothetical protein
VLRNSIQLSNFFHIQFNSMRTYFFRFQCAAATWSRNFETIDYLIHWPSLNLPTDTLSQRKKSHHRNRLQSITVRFFSLYSWVYYYPFFIEIHLPRSHTTTTIIYSQFRSPICEVTLTPHCDQWVMSHIFKINLINGFTHSAFWREKRRVRWRGRGRLL